MRELDIEMFMRLGNFKEAKIKVYDFTLDLKDDYVYIFNNKEEFKSYFVFNGVDISDGLLRSLIVKISMNNKIITFKSYCDYVITLAKHNSKTSFCKSLKKNVKRKQHLKPKK